jgi:hypothetical protein
MNNNHDFDKSNLHLMLVPFILLVILMVMITACTFNLGRVNTSASKTDFARNVEATLKAEIMATFQAQQTQDAAQPVATQPESPNTNATIQAMQATLDAQATSLAPQLTQPVSTQVTPSPAPGASLEPIQIVDWSMEFWARLPSSCEGVFPCWITNDDFLKHFGGNMILTSIRSYFIDPGWPNPYLAFRNKRDNQAIGTVELLVDGTPIIVKTYPKGVKNWSNDAIALSDYQGKKIFVRFMVPGKLETGGSAGAYGGDNPSTHWFVTNIQIFPDYKP